MGYLVNVTNSEIRELLAKRDGHFCQWEHCKKPQFDPADLQDMTIDHVLPVSFCKENGWTKEDTNDLTNLQLLHRRCNSEKGSLLPDENGSYSIPDFKTRQQKVVRVPVTDCCTSGREVLPGDVCVVCGSEAKPKKWPSSVKKDPKNCTHHELDFCYMCLLGYAERQTPYDWTKHYA